MTSFYGQISALMDVMIGLHPQSVLDIGAGFGKYGFLCREYLDIKEGRIHKPQWQIYIEGIDINPETANPVHGFIYDQFHYADAFKIISALERQYDLSLMIDLLGCLEKEQGLEIITNALGISKLLLIVITGDSLTATGHQWKPNDFLKFNIVHSGFLSTENSSAMVMLIKGVESDS